MIEMFKNMEHLQNILRKNKWTITAAESCTGGLIASQITKISGSSDIFRGSVVTYCNDIKEQELGVKKQTMIENGAVSIETVSEMLDGVLKKFDATYAIAVSGIAGPNGGSVEKPVGTVVIGIANNIGYKSVDRYHFIGNREEVQIQAANRAFELIYKKIENL
jgi:nicotinamide-nucleotide amidase